MVARSMSYFVLFVCSFVASPWAVVVFAGGQKQICSFFGGGRHVQDERSEVDLLSRAGSRKLQNVVVQLPSGQLFSSKREPRYTRACGPGVSNYSSLEVKGCL